MSQPSTVNALIGAALAAGATPLKPAAKSFRTVLEVAHALDTHRDQGEPDLVLSSSFGCGAGHSLPPSHMQDHASENSSTFGVPLPPCPGHAHPLSADVAGGVAVWVCPETSRTISGRSSRDGRRD